MSVPAPRCCLMASISPFAAAIQISMLGGCDSAARCGSLSRHPAMRTAAIIDRMILLTAWLLNRDFPDRLAPTTTVGLFDDSILTPGPVNAVCGSGKAALGSLRAFLHTSASSLGPCLGRGVGLRCEGSTTTLLRARPVRAAHGRNRRLRRGPYGPRKMPLSRCSRSRAPVNTSGTVLERDMCKPYGKPERLDGDWHGGLA